MLNILHMIYFQRSFEHFKIKSNGWGIELYMKRELNFLSNGTKRVYLNEHSAFSRAFESWTCMQKFDTANFQMFLALKG